MNQNLSSNIINNIPIYFFNRGYIMKKHNHLAKYTFSFVVLVSSLLVISKFKIDESLEKNQLKYDLHACNVLISAVSKDDECFIDLSEYIQTDKITSINNKEKKALKINMDNCIKKENSINCFNTVLEKTLN